MARSNKARFHFKSKLTNAAKWTDLWSPFTANEAVHELSHLRVPRNVLVHLLHTYVQFAVCY
jgi:hypothetical protein